MTAPAAAAELPRPVLRRRWPGLIWAVPLAALMIVAYLGFQAFAQRGEIVTVTFDRAAGAQPGETKVTYQGAEAGELIKMLPNKDGRRIDFKLRLVPEAKPGLNSNARFWLIGATPSLSDLSSIKAVVQGVTIGYAPGEGGTPTRTFEGLPRAPTVLPGDKGTRYRLDARKLGTVQIGSELLYHGLAIGKVTGVEFKGEAGFRLQVFVFQPYDSLVKPDTFFWRSSPVRLAFSGGTIDASLAPASSILTGGIDVDVPAPAAQSQARADSTFTLFASKEAARAGLTGASFPYDFTFGGAAADLEEGAPVTLLGFQIGEVENARLAFDPHTGRPFTTVTARLFSAQLGDRDPPAVAAQPGPAPRGLAPDPGDARADTDLAVRRLLRLGYRARLHQQPAFVGATCIALVATHASAADLAYDSANPRIPSAPDAGGLDDITTQTDQILRKVNRIPFEAIGRNLQQTTDRLNALTASPELAGSLRDLRHTVKSLDQMLSNVEPQIGPLLTKLNEAAGELTGTAVAARQLLDGQGGQDDNARAALGQLTEAARSVRSLTDYLDRHPEALLRGKRPNP